MRASWGLQAYEKENTALTGEGCVLRELLKGDSEWNAAVVRATQCRFILEFKRTGVWKVRMVIQGFRENKLALDGPGFNYASNVASLSGVRNAILAPMDSTIALASIDTATALLQSDRFGP